ncbi:MAG: hypothetical protein MRJ68_20300 [Nitrospira sp.]|nr:hypothetical protein [Nitrospira sp.]
MYLPRFGKIIKLAATWVILSVCYLIDTSVATEEHNVDIVQHDSPNKTRSNEGRRDVDRVLIIAGLSRDEQEQKLPWLIEKARDSQNADEQFAAVWVLGRLDVSTPYLKSILGLLIQNLSVSDDWIRGESATAIERLCEDKLEFIPSPDQQRIRDALIELTKDPNPWLRERAILALLPWRKQPSVQEALRTGFFDPVSWVRNASVRTGFRVEATPLFPQGISDEGPDVRYVVVLHAKGPDGSTPPPLRSLLVERLRDPSSPVVAETLHQLAATKDRQLVKPILDLLNIGWRNAVKIAIQELTGDELEEVIAKTNWKPNERFARDAPVRTRSDQELKDLLRRSRSENRLERISSLPQLMWVNSPTVDKVFVDSLKDLDAVVRFLVLRVLSTQTTMGLSGVISTDLHEAVVRSLRDTNVHVLTSAAEVWGQLLRQPNSNVSQETRTTVLQELRAIALRHGSGLVRAAASEALLHENVRDRPFWTKLLNDPFSEVRENARIALYKEQP